jgi:ubiquinone/menaquinone biosynthesis C-methylase UbiE
MMRELKVVTNNHTKTPRDYLSRVNDLDFPKWKAAEIAKKWDFDYWDGDRRINYGGYHFREGYWTPVAEKLIRTYSLTSSSKILDIGCGKGFLLYEISKLLPGIVIRGIDISRYAIEKSFPQVKTSLEYGNATNLPWSKEYFDLAYSINTFHNLYCYELSDALVEISRVSKNQFVCVESYRNEVEKTNLLYWQVTCESFYTPKEWKWWFQKYNYIGDYEFIYFE